VGSVERLLNIDEAAELLSLSPNTLYLYICKRTIPFIKIQSSVRFRESDLEVWIEERLVKPVKGGEK